MQMMAGTNMSPMGTYQMFGLDDLARPWKTAVMMTPPSAWKTMMNVTSAARRAAGDSSAAYVGPGDAISMVQAWTQIFAHQHSRGYRR